MAKPRVFVSSTYYDLKHVRSSLENFIESLGFEPILSEKGDIAFTPDSPLDESCYREAANADIFVLMIGGRYGTEASGKQKVPSRTFFERYDSITKKEYENAVARDVPIYVLVESSVYSEYQTYLRNKENKNISYAHVESSNIFRLIEEILSKPRNNPTHTFERFSDIEAWLREQWSGLFRELLQRQAQQQQLASLAAQVTDLRATNETLRRYLEAVMKGITPDKSGELIESEQRRLQELERNEKIRCNPWVSHVQRAYRVSFEDFLAAISRAKSFRDFAKSMASISKDPKVEVSVMDALERWDEARADFNAIRTLLGQKGFRLGRKEAGEPPENGNKK